MTTTPHPADALPLPEPEYVEYSHERTEQDQPEPIVIANYFSEAQYRAARREGYELAMSKAQEEINEQARLLGMGSEREARLMAEVAELRKAQEGREPVARVELMTTGGNVGIATRIVEIDDPLRERLSPGALLYTSPPPKGGYGARAKHVDAVMKHVYRIIGAGKQWEHKHIAAIEQAIWRMLDETTGGSPPPKSDEASLRAAAQAVVDWHGELGHDSIAMAELRAALAAQQKGEATS